MRCAFILDREQAGGAGSGLSEMAERVIASYPYPIALPLQLMAGKTDVEARAKSLVDVLTNALKYQAMVVQSEYLRSELVDEALTSIRSSSMSKLLNHRSISTCTTAWKAAWPGDKRFAIT